MKQIFIDSVIAYKFATPPNLDYENFIKWLLCNDKKNKPNHAYIMLSDKIIGEYFDGCTLSDKATSIGVIIDKMIKDLRFKKIPSNEINSFINKIPKRLSEKKKKGCLQSNRKDWYHFPLVFFSNTKWALTHDKKFQTDLLNYPSLSSGVTIYLTPKNVPYKIYDKEKTIKKG